MAPKKSLETAIKTVYEVPLELSMPRRTAHFLNWAAENYPNQYISYNVILKVINKLPNTPQIKSREVKNLASRMQSVKKVLLSDYQKRMHSLPGVGVRATVDSADVLQNVLVSDARRFDSARRTLTQTANIINPAEIPNSPEMKPLKEWLAKGLKETLRLVNTPEWLQKALPPKPEGDK